jgi:hypothetical protein
MILKNTENTSSAAVMRPERQQRLRHNHDIGCHFPNKIVMGSNITADFVLIYRKRYGQNN